MNTHIQTLADAGARFVECRTKTEKDPKAAVTKEWQKNKPTANQVCGWIDRGIYVGLEPGSIECAVIDLDIRKYKKGKQKGKPVPGFEKIVADEEKAIIDKFGAPLANVKTPSGGRHLFYKSADDVFRNPDWRSGETRHTGGYVVLYEVETVARSLEKRETATALSMGKFLEAFPKARSDVPNGGAGNDAGDGQDKSGRNNRLWGDTFRAGIIGDDKARTNAEKWAKVSGLSEKEIEITSEKGWATGYAARVNKILPLMDATCFEAALTLKGIDYRFNIRSMSPEVNVPDQDGFMSGWEPVDDMKESRMFGDIAREIKLYTGPNTKDKPFDVPLPKRKVFMDDVLEDRRVDPFEDYLMENGPWDNTPRIDTLLIDLFGAEDTELNRWAGRHIPIGGIQRTFRPGCKLDEILVLVGKQGIGKSTLLRQILPEAAYFSDGLNFNGSARERVESLLGYVIVEASEMAGISRAKIDSLKAFISRAEDGSIRLAYRRNKDVLPRRCIIVGTSNEQMVLPNDPTGNRRFVAVKCNKGSDIKKFMDKNRDQIWAEALVRVSEGETANLPWWGGLMEAQTKLNKEFRSQDEELESLIQKLPISDDGLTMDQVFSLLGIKIGGTITQRRMGPALIENGWRKPNLKRSLWVSPEGWAPRSHETEEPI